MPESSALARRLESLVGHVLVDLALDVDEGAAGP